MSTHEPRAWPSSVALPLALALLAIFALAVHADTGKVPFGPHDVRTIFHVTKSENRNQVHYGLRLDDACRPRGTQPVFAYWRRARGDAPTFADAPLEGWGTLLYGASEKQLVKTGPDGPRLSFHVKALERLPIDVHIQKAQNGCQAQTFTTLHGQRARLSHAFIQQGRVSWRVRWVDVVGYRADGTRIDERLKP